MRFDQLSWTSYGNAANPWRSARHGKAAYYHHLESNTYRIFASWAQGGDPRVWMELDLLDAICVFNSLNREDMDALADDIQARFDGENKNLASGVPGRPVARPYWRPRSKDRDYGLDE